jgi:pimeloyl-ACP methyl ester carboxylesterase
MHRARLRCIRSTAEGRFHWIFLPGGPGLGSESLNPLTSILNLPGSIWHLDLPGDGSNVYGEFRDWSQALIEAVEALDNVILVAHSTGGMYALSSPGLEKTLIGLVLLDSAPNASWMEGFSQFVRTHPIARFAEVCALYEDCPDDERLKDMTLASLPYLTQMPNPENAYSFLKSLPYNFRACQWSAQHFDCNYEAQWIPQAFPTLICAGEYDCITPLKLFENDQRFCRENIFLRSIKNAGHFPWIDNPEETALILSEYCRLLPME